MISRRKFLALVNALGLSAALPPLMSSCNSSREIPGKILGANASLGHRLRNMDFGPPTETIQTDFVIVGGGAAGLSAARFLKKHTNNFLLFDLEDHVGGNAAAGSNELTRFPWGAHYLPLPGNLDEELVDFLAEANAITGVRNGLPVFNEYHLCHDPKERLFINNFWQDSLIPHEGVPKSDRDEIQRFLAEMNSYRELTGADGKSAFTIPIEFCSRDPKILQLDSITADEFLSVNNFTSPYLKWYVNYCCADDFGSSISQTSAWAMVHYFASRKGKAANASSDAVLTWPEGNYWLIAQLEKQLSEHVHTRHLVYDVSIRSGKTVCTFFDVAADVSKKVVCDKVILATPQYINQRILTLADRRIDYKQFEYAPWMVANVTVDHPLTEKRGEILCWDNVIYGSDALGYVNAMHQQLGVHGNHRVITYYKPLLSDNVLQARRTAHAKTFSDWRHLVLADLQKPHPEIQQHIREMNMWIWGHGMVRPAKNFVWSGNRLAASEPLDNRIFFAHSDLSGLSIFEEAFYRGHTAAKLALDL